MSQSDGKPSGARLQKARLARMSTLKQGYHVRVENSWNDRKCGPSAKSGTNGVAAGKGKKTEDLWPLTSSGTADGGAKPVTADGGAVDGAKAAAGAASSSASSGVNAVNVDDATRFIVQFLACCQKLHLHLQ